jgi:hypothetical protein
VYILLDEDQDRLDDIEDGVQHRSERELIDTLQEQLRLEREASAELRRIIAGLTQRIPELEPSSEPREEPLSVSGDKGGVEETPDEDQRPWWRRLFTG